METSLIGLLKCINDPILNICDTQYKIYNSNFNYVYFY